MGRLMALIDKNLQSAADGSLPLLMACAGKNVFNGNYFGPMHMFNSVGAPGTNSVRGYGNDATQAKDLWEYSEECFGEKFSI